VVGGIHPTFMPQDFIREYVDVIFIGYADSTFPAYIERLENGREVRDVPNLGLVEAGKLFLTDAWIGKHDLDALPQPDRSLTARYRHRYHDSLRNRLSLVMTSRGCPFRCTFCACWKLMDGRYVTRSADSVVQELGTLSEKDDIVYFSDDNTVHNLKRAWQLAEGLEKRNTGKKLQMYARADMIVKNPDLFECFKRAGLEYVTVGFESVTDKGLEKYHKRSTVDLNDRAIRVLKKLDIYINAHFIVDPQFDHADFERLLHYIMTRSIFRPAFPVLTPLPGTELYSESAGKLAISDYDFYDFAHSVLPTRLDRREFYRNLANLYNRSYALRRFIAYRRESRNGSGDDFYAYNTDGISPALVLLLRVFALPQFMKIKHAYRSEPLV
jgi:radical SAM superfamily enzyme YgiQ (UPF0313 family)